MNWFLFFGAILTGWSMYFLFFLYAVTKKPELVEGVPVIQMLEKAMGTQSMYRFLGVTGSVMLVLGVALILMGIT